MDMFKDSNPSPFSAQHEVSIHKYYAKVFGWMAIGLLLTFAVAGISAMSGLVYRIAFATEGFGSIIALIIQIGLIFYFNSKIRHMEPTKAKIAFSIYSVLTGFDFALFFVTMGPEKVAMAFLCAAIFFGCLAIIGYTTKADLSRLGSICLVALLAFVIFQLLALLFHWSMDVRVISTIGLVIFAGLTAWDMQDVKRTYEYVREDNLATDTYAIQGAFILYLDFLNIFIYILQLIGLSSDDN